MNLCRKILAIIMTFVINSHALAQCPPNIGFEDGTFNHWEAQTGKIDGQNVISLGPSDPIRGRHQIMDKITGDKDKYGHFPTTSPNGGRYSVKLGNEDVNSQAESISYTYKVQEGQDLSLILSYAAVLCQADPDHTPPERPRFTIKVFNVTDNKQIDCPAYDFVGAAALGFKKSDVIPQLQFVAQGVTQYAYYCDWTTTTINLKGYGGKTVRFEFTTNDCSAGSHFGYAYIDLDEQCNNAITGNTYCDGQPGVTLKGPPGFTDYQWYAGNTTTGTPVGYGPTLNLTAPANNSIYTLSVYPFYTGGCFTTFQTVIHKISNEFKLVAPDTLKVCANMPADLTSPNVIKGSTAGIVPSYYLDMEATQKLPLPQSISTPGTYFIKGTSPEGCVNILPVVIKFIDLPYIAPISTKTVQYPGTANITQPFNSDITYQYFKDGAGKIPLTNYDAITASGTYYINATSNVTHCTTLPIPVKVVISPPAPFQLIVPNTFTPNNDGINDVLKVDITGYLLFGKLKVFNRNGALLFTAKKQSDNWAGIYNGHLLPVGTYYWLFEGTDLYYHKPVVKSGPITIIR